MPLRKAFGHLIDHIARLGPINGLRVLWAKKQRPGREVTLDLPQLAGPVTVRTGTSDLAILDEVVIDGGYDLPVRIPPQVIIDVGANIGLATLWFKKCYPAARIIALEPDPGNFDLLRRNVAHLPDVELVQAALSSHDGIAGWATQGLGHSAFHLKAHVSGEAGVEAMTMSTVLSRFALDKVDLLKLDIEGGEKELFEADDLAWMDRVDTLAVELHDRLRPGCGHAFFRAASRRPRNYDVHGQLVIASRD